MTMSEEEYSNGKSFTDFEKLTTDQKLNYVYMELVAQRTRHADLKKELKWYITIFGGILLAAYEFGKALVKRKFGLDG